ncbi:hypothetical protein BN871_BV_00210 [Paenibacillus sp. P22]|nr:hypothetical protein BN871_BV_00210 [Paenibacillus sp. P22]
MAFIKRGNQCGFLSCRCHKRKKNIQLGLKALVQQGRGTGTQQRNRTGLIQRGAPTMATLFDKGDDGPSASRAHADNAADGPQT